LEIAVFWFRRDLRIEDNHGLLKALKSGLPLVPLFIFDTHILSGLPNNDARVNFIHERLQFIHKQLNEQGSSLIVKKGEPVQVWKEIVSSFKVKAVFANHDYEPYSISRDNQVKEYLKENEIPFFTLKDQVIFEKNEVPKTDGKPYTIYTPFKNKWLEKFAPHSDCQPYMNNGFMNNFIKKSYPFPELKELGFTESKIKVPEFKLENILNYGRDRDFPGLDKSTLLGPHLRFGTVSIRQIVKIAFETNQTFLNELIWREFFMAILFHFPAVVSNNFKPQYNHIKWLNKEDDFEKWKNGKTGYPLVDAGMRQLNQTGFMHNRVRMITAGFLCKHLLVDWRWGEAYFAEKLLDYELSSNNGNWQWAAGTGCDAAPYFRVFNPETQLHKFDPDFSYIKKWLPDLNNMDYPVPIVEHKMAHERAINTYKKALWHE